MRYDVATKLDELTGHFCETFGYHRSEFQNFSKKSEDVSVDEAIMALNSTFFSFMDLEIIGYAKDFHVNRVCHAIEEGTFPYPISRRTKQLYRQYKNRRWKEEAQLYGFRLRWQIRLNRIFPGVNIRIPAIEEIVSNRVLRFFSAVGCIRSRIAYASKHETLDDFVYMDLRYGHPINVRGRNIDLLDLFFPGRMLKSVQGSNLDAIGSSK